MPRSRRLRLKPWPNWAVEEYEAIILAVRLLQRDSEVALEIISRNPDDLELSKLLTQLKQYIRVAELSIARMEIARQDRQGERWPRWVIRAVKVVSEQGDTAVWKVELADVALLRKDKVELERLLNDCLSIGQQLELVLLEGPPPKVTTVVGTITGG